MGQIPVYYDSMENAVFYDLERLPVWLEKPLDA
jgi:hypothetical protein